MRSHFSTFQGTPHHPRGVFTRTTRRGNPIACAVIAVAKRVLASASVVWATSDGLLCISFSFAVYVTVARPTERSGGWIRTSVVSAEPTGTLRGVSGCTAIFGSTACINTVSITRAAEVGATCCTATRASSGYTLNLSKTLVRKVTLVTDRQRIDWCAYVVLGDAWRVERV